MNNLHWYDGNIKVHYAGAESWESSRILAFNDVKYVLFSVLPFIGDKFGLKVVKNIFVKELNPRVYLDNVFDHVIMDSGIYSLMYGVYKKRRSYEFFEEWTHAIINFVQEKNINSTIVECDCQKMLGVKEAWKLRELIHRELPNHDIINVFHWEDGEKGLDRLIEFSDYLAIGVPEFKKIVGKRYKDFVFKTVRYIKRKKPKIKIHLLGTSADTIVSKNKIATSCDSTSYSSVVRFGHYHCMKMIYMKKYEKDKLYAEIRPIIENIEHEINHKLSDKMKENILYIHFGVKIYKKKYEISSR